ncbi:MAG: acetate--CoA ligase family protein, partial [Chloroflexota bacterium]
SNPVDILAGSGPDLYSMALEALLADPAVDAALVIMAPNDWFLPADLAEAIADVAAGHDKPVLASLMGRQAAEEALPVLNRRQIPNFAYPERAGPALAAMLARRRWLETPAEPEVKLDDVDMSAAREALARDDFPAALAAYGIRLAPAGLAGSAEEAAQQAEAIGYPVALKIDSQKISHKTEVGGVILDLADGPAVRAAYETLVARAQAAGTALKGVLVQKMLRGGQELIVGLRRDPQFGPLALVGGGGTEVELRRDVALGIAPLNQRQAGEMLDETLAGALLKGWRGQAAGDRAAVIAALRRLAQIGHDFPEIEELEINPLYVLPVGSGAYALDVRGAFWGKKEDPDRIDRMGTGRL